MKTLLLPVIGALLLGACANLPTNSPVPDVPQPQAFLSAGSANSDDAVDARWMLILGHIITVLRQMKRDGVSFQA
jgi:hypothetical protein